MSHAAAAHHHAEEFDARGHKDHGHIIVNIWTLRTVLAVLLFFTLLTSGAAVAEEWVSQTFNVVVPQAINVGVALSIAVVKTALVVLFFMQLKYDNPLNSMIFVFTVLTVAFFLGFTALDVGNRKTIDSYKGNYIYRGGTGLGGKMQPNESIADWAKRAAAAEAAHGHAAAGHGHGGKSHELLGSFTQSGYKRDLPAIGSSEDRARPVTGVTLPGFAEPKPADAHGDAPAAGKPADTHAQPEKPGEPAKPAQH